MWPKITTFGFILLNKLSLKGLHPGRDPEKHKSKISAGGPWDKTISASSGAEFHIISLSFKSELKAQLW